MKSYLAAILLFLISIAVRKTGGPLVGAGFMASSDFNQKSRGPALF
jgi:hypothetical protein